MSTCGEEADLDLVPMTIYVCSFFHFCFYTLSAKEGFVDNFTEQTLNLGRFVEMLTALSEMGKRPGSRGASGGMMGK